MIGQSPSCRSEINVTPYIDILLVLLIIFMVIQPTSQHDLKTRTPSLPEANTSPATHEIVIGVAPDGAVSINREEVSLAELGSRLFGVLNRRADKRVFIRASSKLPFGDIVHVIDIAKGAGAGDIGLLEGS